MTEHCVQRWIKTFVKYWVLPYLSRSRLNLQRKKWQPIRWLWYRLTWSCMEHFLAHKDSYQTNFWRVVHVAHIYLCISNRQAKAHHQPISSLDPSLLHCRINISSIRHDLRAHRLKCISEFHHIRYGRWNCGEMVATLKKLKASDERETLLTHGSDKIIEINTIRTRY